MAKEKIKTSQLDTYLSLALCRNVGDTDMAEMAFFARTFGVDCARKVVSLEASCD